MVNQAINTKVQKRKFTFQKTVDCLKINNPKTPVLHYTKNP